MKLLARRRPMAWASAALLLIGWLILYLPHLRTNPGWYGDESLTLMIGRSLFSGDGGDRALYATFWHPSYAYQPCYAWLVGLSSFLAGGDILGARFLNSLLALAIALLIFFGARSVLGRNSSLFGALMFLCYDQSVIHFRWVYPHNAVAFGFALVVLCLLRKSSARSDWSAGIGLAVAAGAHPLFVHGALAAWICRIKRPWAWVRMAVLPALVLVGGVAWTIGRQSPHLWVFDDIRSLGAFYAKFSRENGSGLQSFQNIGIFFTHDFFHVGAAIAALLCCRRRLYVIPLFLAIVSGLLLQNRQNLTIFYYQAVVFLPVMALAWAGAARTIEIRLRCCLRSTRSVRFFWIVAYVVPLAIFFPVAAASVRGALVPRNQPWVTQNTDEVEKAAEWLSKQVQPQDLVICHQNIGWILPCRTADLMQTTAWSGRPTFTFDPPPPHDRFRYPADLDAAKFIVLADIDQRWSLGQPNMSWIVEKVAAEKWPVVWQGPNYLIVANPHFLLGNSQ